MNSYYEDLLTLLKALRAYEVEQTIDDDQLDVLEATMARVEAIDSLEPLLFRLEPFVLHERELRTLDDQ